MTEQPIASQAPGTSPALSPTADISSVAHSTICCALGLRQNAEIPDYFKFGGDYHKDQFKIGWTARTIIAGRLPGDGADFIHHPDAGKSFEELPEGVRKFIAFFSEFQVAIFGRLSPDELLELRQAGTQYRQALATTDSEAKSTIFVQEPLLGKVNAMHHQMWMAARDLAKTLDPSIAIRDHAAHKGINLMTADEVAADNPSVQGYALVLDRMPQEHFDWLVGKCTG